jgi:hypothetical protein
MSCHHLQSEHVEVEDMHMTEVKGTNKVEEHDYPMNHWLGEERMNMMEEHYHPTNHQLEVEDMDMVDIHMVEERSSNHRPEVEGIDREDTDMGEDMMVEVRWLKKSTRA